MSHLGCGACAPERYASDASQEGGLGLGAADPSLVHYSPDPGFRSRSGDIAGCDGVHAYAHGPELFREHLL